MQEGNEGIALLVIDVQQALFAKSTPVFQADSLLATINHMAQRARAEGALVVYVQHGDKRALAPDTEGWRLHPSLQVETGDLYVGKQHPNAFEQTSLDDTLRARDVGHVVVCGLVTHGCVRATCLGGRKAGYRVTLVADGHSSYNKDAATLIAEWNRTLADAGVLVLPAAAVRFAQPQPA
jgi:nicotinamidase-related amidase